MSFRELHDGELPFLLPNAWDVASALAFVAAGFPAVGTTSFGVAARPGTPTAGAPRRTRRPSLAAQLARLPVPASTDIEDGYDDDPDAVAAYVAALGVAGINIEDSTEEALVAPQAHAAKVAAIKRAAPDVFVNARVDTYWLGQDATVAATLERAAAYVAAGADGVFVPGATDPGELRELRRGDPGAAQRPRRARPVAGGARRARRPARQHRVAALSGGDRRRGRRRGGRARRGRGAVGDAVPEMQARLVDYSGT